MFVVVMLSASCVPLLLSAEPVVENAAAQGENIVKVGWTSEILIWNPLKLDMTEDYVAAYLMYSALWTYDEDYQGPVGDLALSWNQTLHPGGTMTTWVNLTHNAYFRSSAAPDDKTHQLKAEDVVHTIDIIQANGGGAWDYYVENITSVTAIDPFTVSIVTDYWKGTLLQSLTNIPILPWYIWSGVKNPLGNMAPGDNVGSGPFYFDGWLRGSWYQFTKAPNYHGAADYPSSRAVQIDGILYKVYTDVSAMVLDMNKGNQDVIMLTGDVNLYKDSLGDPGQTTVRVYKHAVQEPGITDIAINAIPEDFRTNQWGFGNKLLLDPAVRKAIMMTLNKTYIKDNIYYGLSIIADSVIWPGYTQWYYKPLNQVSYGPLQAKALLIANGYVDTDTDGILEVTGTSMAAQQGWADVGDELSGIRLQAPDTDSSWGLVAYAWAGWALQAGIRMTPSVENEPLMVNKAWYKADYDVWVWHWGWSPEPLGDILSIWLTNEMEYGGDNCQMPMGPWWYGKSNQTSSPTGTPYSAFDQNMSLAQHTYDPAARKPIVDKLQQWIYDSYTENPSNYDLGLYGFTDARYTGWGNWTEHSGRTIYSTLPWVWFDLRPAVNKAPQFDIPPSNQDVIKNVPWTFEVTVSDPDGDPLSINWSFGDAGPGTDAQNASSTNTNIPTKFTQTHTYTTAATGLKLNVTAWDGQPFHEVQATATINVVTTPNLGPVIVSLSYGTPPPVYNGTPVSWSCTARDNESGTSGYGILFTWDWGDGTYSVYHAQPLANNVPYTDTRTHAWNSAGTYNVKVSIWDGYDVETNPNHNVSVSLDYRVIENTPPEVPWIPSIYGLRNQAIPCSATSSDSDADTITFTWDWKDGTYTVTTDTGPGNLYSQVTHTWSAAGTFSVDVYVDDGTGAAGHNVSGTAVVTISTPASQVPPMFGTIVQYPEPARPGSPVSLNVSAADANSNALAVMVDYGDGNVSTATTAGGTTGWQSVNLSHAYESVGTYTVTVYLNDSFADGTHNMSTTYSLSVESVPANTPPSFTLQSTYTAYYNQTFSAAPVTIWDLDGDPLTVWYDWGDGSPLTKGNATGTLPYVAIHVYNETGDFTLNVSVDDGQGNNVSREGVVTVSDANLKPMIVTWSVEPALTKHKVGDTVWFNLTVFDLEGDDLTIVINFGDGSDTETLTLAPLANNVSELQSFSHEFTKASETGYKVTVIVKDDQDHSNMTWQSRETTIFVEKAGGGGGLSTAALIGIAAAIVIIALIIALMLMRKKKEGPEKEAVGGMEGMAPPPPEPPSKK